MKKEDLERVREMDVEWKHALPGLEGAFLWAVGPMGLLKRLTYIRASVYVRSHLNWILNPNKEVTQAKLFKGKTGKSECQGSFICIFYEKYFLIKNVYKNLNN